MLKNLSLLFTLSLFTCALLNSTNQITLETYELKIKEYIQNTPELSIALKKWLNCTLSYIKTEDTILELGSGFGQDAKYIESLGYKVERTDAVQGFITLLKSDGFEAKSVNILKDKLGTDYSLIVANSVLHHFTPQELEIILMKINESLNFQGILSFCVKKGSGESISDEILGAPRYFCYWMPSDLKTILVKNGFEVLDLTIIPEGNTERICLIARKIKSLI